MMWNVDCIFGSFVWFFVNWANALQVCNNLNSPSLVNFLMSKSGVFFWKCKVLLNLGCFGRSYFAKDRSVSTRSCCDFSFKHFLQQRKSLSQWKSWFQRQKHFVINSNWEIRNQWINAKLGSCLDSRISFKPLYMMSDGPEGVNCTSYRPLYLKHTHYNSTKGPACM